MKVFSCLDLSLFVFEFFVFFIFSRVLIFLIFCVDLFHYLFFSCFSCLDFFFHFSFVFVFHRQTKEGHSRKSPRCCTQENSCALSWTMCTLIVPRDFFGGSRGNSRTRPHSTNRSARSGGGPQPAKACWVEQRTQDHANAAVLQSRCLSQPNSPQNAQPPTTRRSVVGGSSSCSGVQKKKKHSVASHVATLQAREASGRA